LISTDLVPCVNLKEKIQKQVLSEEKVRMKSCKYLNELLKNDENVIF